MTGTAASSVHPDAPAGVSRVSRVLLAGAIGLLAAVVVQFVVRAFSFTSDFDQSWLAARALLAGMDPYAAIGPGRALPQAYPYLYPLTTALIAIPFAPLAMSTARALFTAVSSALLAFAITRRGHHQLLVFCSAGYVFCLLSAQWSPLLTAAALVAPLSWTLVAKPPLGLALFVAWPTRIAVLGGSALVLASVVVMPHWPLEWWRLIRHVPHMRVPLLTPAGPLMLLALLRWRRPEARLLAALSLMPQTMLLYVTVPLFLVPAAPVESALLAALSWLAAAVTYGWGAQPPAPAFWTRSSVAIVALLYVPCLVMVLRRPNEGAIPALWRASRP